MINKLKMQQ